MGCKCWDWEGRQNDKRLQQDKGKTTLKRLVINDNNSICFAVQKSSSFDCNLASKIVNLMRSMSCLKKRKNLEGRMSDDEWLVKYFVVQQNARALCLIFRNNIACLKQEYQATLQLQAFRKMREILCQLLVGKPISWRCNCKGNRKWYTFTQTTLILWLNWALRLVKQQQIKENLQWWRNNFKKFSDVRKFASLKLRFNLKQCACSVKQKWND